MVPLYTHDIVIQEQKSVDVLLDVTQVFRSILNFDIDFDRHTSNLPQSYWEVCSPLFGYWEG